VVGVVVSLGCWFLLVSGRKNRTNSRLMRVRSAAANPGAQKP